MMFWVVTRQLLKCFGWLLGYSGWLLLQVVLGDF